MVDVAAPPSGAGAPPHWDTSAFFPGLDSRELALASEQVVADLARLRASFDEHGIRGGERRPVTDADVTAVEAALPALNALMERSRLVSGYVHAHTTTDASDAEAARLASRLQADLAPVATLVKRLEAWVARVGAAALVERSAVAADHAFWLQRAERAAAHQMSEAEEDLAAELGLTGGRAWQKLHADVTARLVVEVPGPEPGRCRVLPMAAARGLATDPDAAVRRAAFDAEIAAWETVAVPLAASLNAFKGEANALNRRRGWSDSLDPALHDNNVDRATLHAMQAAVLASLPDFARYNRAKAALLGHPSGALPWWDLLAPVGRGRRFAWPEATHAVGEAFATYSPKLAGLVQRAVDERWLDAEPRPGKVGGAFCMPVEGDASRVLVNFDGSFDSVQTLAHELGHAYHNTNLAGRTALQRRTPMALAETASIFCETVMVQAGLARATDAATRLAILDTDLAGATQVVADIHSRFLFERALCAERDRGVLSVERLCELMTGAQQSAYLDGVDHDHLHPYLWAVKGHYYTAYYNWPYTFGLLFGTGLYASYRRDPDQFRQGYDDLLSATGLGDAAELAARFGIDVRDEAFWAASLDVLRGRIDDFCALAEAAPPPGPS
ncbi:MAG: M3 family oligoendopeptidase [Actinobacteria bacterium]|nr:M3 family oligoendopeptidase [Actinomycetota bacterium]